MAAQRGFCPYCAHVNPPDFKFCVNCTKRLPPEVLGVAAGGPPTKEDLDEAAGGRPVEPPEPVPPKSARWVILLLTVGIVAVVLVASIGLLTHLLAGTPANGSSAPETFVRTDQCDNATGAGCKGSQITLPYTSSGGLSENVSGCLPIFPKGNAPRLWLNFTTTARIHGVLIPQPLYSGGNVSYSTNPAGFYNDSIDVSQAPWNSGAVLGGALVNVTIPAGIPSWCVAWWNSGDPGTITLTADLFVLTVAN